MTDITIIYGTDAAEMTCTLLRDAAVEKRLDSGMNIVIKPNLVVAKSADGGATTHPEIVEGIVLFLKKHGIKSITIAEGSWLGETTGRAFERCGFTALAKKHGLKLIDTKSDKVVKHTAHGLTLGVCETIASADFLINVPVLKGHCQTTMTCCLKNMKGCIPDAEKRRYHNIGLHQPIAALNTILRPDLHVVDGICGDPTFEEGGNPVVSNRIMLGTDPVLLDSYGALLLGYDPNDIDYSLGSICLRGSKSQIITTDGRQALMQDGFAFPWTDDVLCPVTKIFGSKELRDMGNTVQIGFQNDWLYFEVGNITFWMKPIEGKFPQLDQFTRNIDHFTWLNVNSGDAEFTIQRLDNLPGNAGNCVTRLPRLPFRFQSKYNARYSFGSSFSDPTMWHASTGDKTFTGPFGLLLAEGIRRTIDENNPEGVLLREKFMSDILPTVLNAAKQQPVK